MEARTAPQTSLGPRLKAGLSLIGDAFVVIFGEARGLLRFDWVLLALAAIFLVAMVPLIPRATGDALILNSFINDETPLTMALDGMRVWPFGNPSNYLLAPSNGIELPDYWLGFSYWFFTYYGGAYLDLAFLVYGPLHALGLPALPTAPIILRTISTLMGLLALIFTYNFAKQHSGRIAALVAALLVLTDSYFIYYSAIIHPDSMQFALGMLALAVALHHSRNGDIASLVAIGLMAGLVQGTKFGGPWLIPVAALAATLGLRLHQPMRPLWPFLRRLVGRGALMGVVALAMYVVTTPYGILSPHYFARILAVSMQVTGGGLTQISLVSWVGDLAKHFGPVILIAAAAGLAVVALQALRGTVRWPMIFAATLGLSQLVWYGLNGRLWVELGYMLCLFAVIGLLMGDLLQGVTRWLSRGGVAGRGAAVVVVGLSVLALVGSRWWGTAAVALNYRMTEFSTAVDIGRWADKGNIPRDARILWDDVAYFDPSKYPNIYRRGDLLKYTELYTRRPDYIVLSSTIYGAKHYAELLKTQRYTMQNEGRYSVRLYQDLLKTKEPGWTGVPGVAFVRDVAQDYDRREDCPAAQTRDRPYRLWFGETAPSTAAGWASRLVGGGALGAWLSGQVSTQVYLANHAGRLIDALRGKVCVTSGPTLKLYRIHPPGTADGFQQPVASSWQAGHEPVNAFDGKTSDWRPEAEQITDSWVGFDFGRQGDRPVRTLRIDWRDLESVADQVEVQFAELNSGWTSAGLFDVTARTIGDAAFPSSEHALPANLGAHRRWRVVIRDIRPGRTPAIREVRFLEQD